MSSFLLLCNFATDDQPGATDPVRDAVLGAGGAIVGLWTGQAEHDIIALTTFETDQASLDAVGRIESGGGLRATRIVLRADADSPLGDDGHLKGGHLKGG